MKIAITVVQPSLESEIDPRLGRCAFFLIVDLEKGDHSFLENPNLSAPRGSGIQTVHLLSEKGVNAVLTGNCGPNAYQAFSVAGISVYSGISGLAANAIELYKSAKLTPTEKPSVKAATRICKTNVVPNVPLENTDSIPKTILLTDQLKQTGRRGGIGEGRRTRQGNSMGRGLGKGNGGGMGCGRGKGQGRGGQG